MAQRSSRMLMVLGWFALYAAPSCKQSDNPVNPAANTQGAQFGQGYTPPPAAPLPPPVVIQAPAPAPVATPGGCVSAATCTPARQDVITTSVNGVLTGMVGQPVNWVFYGRDLNSLNSVQVAPGVQSSTRRVMVLLSQLPLGAQLSPLPTSQSLFTQESIVWTPNATNSGSMLLLLRDYDRCLVSSPNAQQSCNSLAQTQFDFTGSVSWKIMPYSAAPGMDGGNTTAGFLGGVLGGALGSLITGLATGSSPMQSPGPYIPPGQNYPNCNSNGGAGYGCIFSCGNNWCAKDNQDLNVGSMCVMTQTGGSVCQ